MPLDIIQLIMEVGFPIAAFCWLAFRQQKSLDNNTTAINKLSLSIESCPLKAKR